MTPSLDADLRAQSAVSVLRARHAATWCDAAETDIRDALARVIRLAYLRGRHDAGEDAGTVDAALDRHDWIVDRAHVRGEDDLDEVEESCDCGAVRVRREKCACEAPCGSTEPYHSCAYCRGADREGDDA